MPKKSRKNVGLIGLGIIGSRVANSLRLGGFHVYVWNRTPRVAPNFLASPKEIAQLCDIIQIFVSDAHALFDVLEAMGPALTPSHIILCNATVGPEATLDAAKVVQDHGAQFLDAPFTGSKAAAQNRELVYYIGGDDKTLQAVEPVLKASSKAIVKIGKIGDAAVVKVATNMISAVTVQVLAEAYAIVKASGIDPKSLSEAMKPHAVRSGISDAKLAKILDRDYDPHFSLKHMFKDVQLGIHIGNSLEIDLPATTSTAGVMYGGLTRGWADEDFAVLARAYQKEFSPPPLYAGAPAKSAESVPATPVEIKPPRDIPVPAEKGAGAAPTPMPSSTAPAAAPASTPSSAPAEPVAAKEEAIRDSTPEELRNVGIVLPSAPVPQPGEEPPVLELNIDPPKAPNAEAAPPPTPAPEPPRPVETNRERMPVEPAKAEPKTGSVAAKLEGASTPPAGSNPEEPAEAGNGAPGEPARAHTFVRIRRWFGTGSPH